MNGFAGSDFNTTAVKEVCKTSYMPLTGINLVYRYIDTLHDFYVIQCSSNGHSHTSIGADNLACTP
jgi:hypothetical protein